MDRVLVKLSEFANKFVVHYFFGCVRLKHFSGRLVQNLIVVFLLLLLRRITNLTSVSILYVVL